MEFLLSLEIIMYLHFAALRVKLFTETHLERVLMSACSAVKSDGHVIIL